jgi:hypothetical protein
MFKSVKAILTVFGTALLSANVHAACTYDEAMMAFNNGNQIRGQALMRMAASDGDERAVHFLSSTSFAVIYGHTELSTDQPALKASNFAVGDGIDSADTSRRKSDKNS